MRISLRSLKTLIQEAVINEVDIENVKGIACTTGSTHVMKTCKLGKDKYFLKFSDESMFDDSDPSLQILIEYLSYKIYSLYPSITIPNVELVYDKTNLKVGLASSVVVGKSGLQTINPKKLGKMMSAGVYVDVLLANWDVVGTGTGNVLVDKQKLTRIDPGGSLTFRAQGGRKGEKFGAKPAELSTMLDPNFGGSGEVLTHADMNIASVEFLSVSWSAIASTIKSVSNSVSSDLKSRGMSDLLGQWKVDVAEISTKLAKRHKSILDHIKASSKL